MAATTAQGLYDEFKANGQRIFVVKGTQTLAASTWGSSWTAAGLTPAGSGTTTGKANGATCDKTTTGALPYCNPRSGRRLYLVGLGWAAGTGSQWTLVDRLAHVTVAQNETSGAITGVTGTARLDSASAGNDFEGGQIYIEVLTALGAGDNVFTLGYTNQDGTAGQTTKQFTVKGSTGVGRCVTADNFCFITLQDGDRSVRSIDSINLISGTGTGGTMTISLVRPIYDWSAGLGYTIERDLIAQQCIVPEIVSNSCLFMIVNQGATTGIAMGWFDAVDV